MRVFIVGDMEGVAGICRWEQVMGGEPLYEEGRRLYTEEINAAVRGARAAGATEIVVMEALAGVRSERERRAVREHLFALPMLALRGVLDYERAAELYCRLRSRGVTPRQLTDLLIVVCALNAGASLLHSDRDFDRVAEETGLPIHPHLT